MRMLYSSGGGHGCGAAAIAMMAAPALADPPSGTAPKATDVVGVDSDTIQNVSDQFSHDYNASHTTGSKLYSWDATNPKTGAIGAGLWGEVQRRLRMPGGGLSGGSSSGSASPGPWPCHRTCC